MPLRGPPPKRDGEKRFRGQSPHEWHEVENVAFDGPKLPKLRCNGKPWSARVREKWETWRTMPHACLWAESDWAFAETSAEVAERFYEGNNGAAAELRLRESVLGTTWDSRRSLRIRYVEQRKPQLAEVVDVDDYREL